MVVVRRLLLARVLRLTRDGMLGRRLVRRILLIAHVSGLRLSVVASWSQLEWHLGGCGLL